MIASIFLDLLLGFQMISLIFVDLLGFPKICVDLLDLQTISSISDDFR